MNANVGDRIIVRGHQAGDPNREAVIVEAYGVDGQPPYVVRWSNGREGLFFPGSDANVEHAGRVGQRVERHGHTTIGAAHH